MAEQHPVGHARRSRRRDTTDPQWTERIRALRVRASALESARGISGVLALRDAPESAVEVRVDLHTEHLEVHSERGLIGWWPLSEITVQRVPEGFRLFVENEELLLTTDADTSLAVGLGIPVGSDEESDHVSGHFTPR